MLSVYSPRQLGGRRYVGDKRKGIVYDLEDVLPEAETPAAPFPANAPPADMSSTGTPLAGVPRAVIDELLESGQYLCFAPDTLPEALNRGYRQSRLSARGFAARLSGRRLPHSRRRA